MQNTYTTWLQNQGYSLLTPSGRPSSIYDYLRGIKRVCREENIVLEEAAEHIDELSRLYRRGGQYESIGRKISGSVAASVAQFKKFVAEQARL